MAGRQLVGLEHAGALADGHETPVERELQRPLGRLAARPRMVLLHQHVVVDVADRQRTVAPEEGEDLAQVLRLHRSEPCAATPPVPLHGADVETHVGCGHVRQGVRPVFEHRLVEALRPVEVVAPIVWYPRKKDMMVAALDDVDGVDLHVSQVLDCRARRLGPAAEGRVEPLRVQPDTPGRGFAERDRLSGHAGIGPTGVWPL